MHSRAIAALFAIVVLLLLMGCGSNSKSTSTNTPTPTPGTTTPAGGTGTGSGGTGTGGSTLSSAPDNYFATEFLENGALRMAVGSLSVDVSANNGAGSAHGDSGFSNSQKLQFCPYLGAFSNCFDVASFTLDSQGMFNFNFTFPHKGAQFGVFRLVTDPGGGEVANFGAGVATQTGSPSFTATLLLAAMVPGGVGESAGTASLTHGTVTVTGVSTGNGTFANSYHFELTGVPANDTFTPKICFMQGPSRCVFLSTFKSDASGNASASVTTITDNAPVVVLVMDGQGVVEYISGFRVQ